MRRLPGWRRECSSLCDSLEKYLRTLRRSAEQAREHAMRQRIVRGARLLIDRYYSQFDAAILLTPIGGRIARDEIRGAESARNDAIGGDSLVLKIACNRDRAISRQVLVELRATSRIAVRIDVHHRVGLLLQNVGGGIENRIGAAPDYRTIRIELQSLQENFLLRCHRARARDLLRRRRRRCPAARG